VNVNTGITVTPLVLFAYRLLLPAPGESWKKLTCAAE
jgi:hypothetical protein